MDRSSEFYLIAGAAVVGSVMAIILFFFQITEPVSSGVVGFAMFPWIIAWGRLRHKEVAIQSARQRPTS